MFIPMMLWNIFLTIVDDCNILIHFIALVKTQFGKIVKQIQSNNAKELAITQFLQDQGILLQFSCV